MEKQMMMGEDEGEMDSLYASGEPADKGKGENESIDQEEAESETAMVPNKILQGKSGEPLKEGDEVVLKIVKNFGDESEVAYSETKPGEIGGGEGAGADEELDAMDKGNPGGMGY